MSAQRATDTSGRRAITEQFLRHEDGELTQLTNAMNDGNYDVALEVGKRISVLMNRIISGHISKVAT